MTKEESEIIELLGQAASKFSQLDQEHASDLSEFAFAVHACQNIVLSREGLRSYRADRQLPEEWARPTALL